MTEPKAAVTFINITGEDASPTTHGLLDRLVIALSAYASDGGCVTINRYDDSAVELREAKAEVFRLTGLNTQANTTIAELRALLAQQPPTPPQPAGGFDAPVGTPEERAAMTDLRWPGTWFDANRYLNHYNDSAGNAAYHTGADLNNNKPTWDSDKLAPVYACADGVVKYAGVVNNYWRSVVIIQHGSVVARYAHLADFTVSVGQAVVRGQQIGRVGFSGPAGPYHLHFDLSPTDALIRSPGHWPGNDAAGVRAHYVDPLDFIRKNRPQ